MNAAGPHPILDGETVVLLPPEQRSPQVGDIVAALIDGETCLKRLVRGGSRKARRRGDIICAANRPTARTANSTPRTTCSSRACWWANCKSLPKAILAMK